MNKPNELTEETIASLAGFFNTRHDKLLCTANKNGEPSIAIMGTPRVVSGGNVEFEISDPVSRTLDNIRDNNAVCLMVYTPAERARDYEGVRIYAKVDDIDNSSEKFEGIKNKIRERHGDEKAAELQATVSCTITDLRPMVDRGQEWDKPPFGNV
ncbi:pyridoxamine 5'-phosphate oxidase family protein [Mucilaginibacter corticis]|uniref:Pyridoxamine 5'-phosphate oxidase family protein n=1 Tax=Mucilaginibacter corticis TaxID=2597670 RepID=A0A556MVN6_9SPHI|nr:pyridoxamine 5'-phosphate oxidase family protein [Mucilaginibacter corticis]TSJ43996.1 pyridoxamine 5'-phosphate oxidase family protein [Mucilaginibacter corticis]